MQIKQLSHENNFSVNDIDRRLHEKLNPFIFSYSSPKWPAFHRWNMQFFKKTYGDVQVTINYNLPDNISPYLHDAQLYTKQMCLADFFEEMPNETRGCYLAQSEITIFSQLENDFNFNELIPAKEHHSKTYTYLWIGKNTRSGLHYDFEDNFLVQVLGVKKVFLVAPKYAQYVYPLPENFLKSQVNPMNPNFEMHPKFKHVTLFEGELKAGEILFIPKGWYHYIYSPEESISINCWYGPSLSITELVLSFYRSGLKTWLTFIRDFFWFGMFGREAKERLYCSSPVGKICYEWLAAKINKFFRKE